MSKLKKTEPVAGEERCKSEACKQPQARFTFCNDHYEWFKFGLITKEGRKASDFEKKLAHYEAYVEKQRQYQKVA